MKIGEEFIFIKQLKVTDKIVFNVGDTIILEGWHYNLDPDIESYLKPNTSRYNKLIPSSWNRFWDSFWKKLAILVALLVITYKIGESRKEIRRFIYGNNPTLTELVKNSEDIQRILCEINDLTAKDTNGVPAHRSMIYLADNYKIGAFLEEGKISDIKVIATNECKLMQVSSLMEVYPVTELFYFKDIIDLLEKNNGIFIVDAKNPAKAASIKQQMMMIKVQALVEKGLYRKSANVHQKEYLIGAVAVTFVNDKHTFTEAEISIIKSKTESIAYLIENLYLQYVK